MTMCQKLRKYMLENNYTHTEEWLAACVEWIQENFSNVTEALAMKQVYEQWIDTNLEEMASSCLPPNLAAQRCLKLAGKYGVQLNSIEDIGESAYSQWKQIKKLENDNVNVTAAANTDNQWAPKPRRCLYLTVTDGSQKVFGLELNPIPALSLNLKPGVKLLLLGPIESRRGILQLRPVNVRVLGGEVETFRDTHSVDVLLRERLTPSHQANSDTQRTSSGKPKPKQLKIDGFMKPMPVIIKPPTPVRTNSEYQSSSNNQAPSSSSSSRQMETDEEIDDDELMDLDIIEELERVEREALEEMNSKTHNPTMTTSSTANPARPLPVKSTGVVLPIKNSPTTYPIKVSSKPYAYIQQIHENLARLVEKGETVYVKACVSTVVSNIAVVNNVWTLTVSLNDGTGSIHCKIAAELLNKIIGFNPSEMKQLKALKTPIAKQQITQGMQELTAKLLHLSAIFGIQLKPDPVVVNFTDVLLHHISSMKQRVSVVQRGGTY